MADDTSESINGSAAKDETEVSPPAGPVEAAIGKAPPSEGQDHGGAEAKEDDSTIDLSAIDELIATEDPDFIRALDEVKEGGIDEQVQPEIPIETLDIEHLQDDVDGGSISERVRRLIGRLVAATRAAGPALKEGVKRLLDELKENVRRSTEFITSRLEKYRALPNQSKRLLWAAVCLGVLSVFTLLVSVSGILKVEVGPRFLASFEQVADAAFVYGDNEPFEDFMDPLFHAEHIVAMDRIIVNLKRPRNAPERNPMGFFDLYFEASNQECAVEMKDREGEVRDLVARTLEQMTYEELITLDGKEKMKSVLRKSLNGFLTRGQIRRVYLKNIILKE